MSGLDFFFDRPDWWDNAACRTSHPDVFFPTRGEDTHEAKAICAGCPVASECLAGALERREMFGIWGGRSERQRRRIRSTSGMTVHHQPTFEPEERTAS